MFMRWLPRSTQDFDPESIRLPDEFPATVMTGSIARGEVDRRPPCPVPVAASRVRDSAQPLERRRSPALSRIP